MTQSNATRGPDRAVVQLPGRKGQSGAVLRVRGVPQDADVYGVVIKRGSRWLGPEGWSSDPIETPVRKSNGEAGTVDLALSETLSSEIPVGASLAIQVPGHDVSDTIIWRSLAPVAGDAASPSRAAGKSGARRAGSDLPGRPTRPWRPVPKQAVR